MKFDLYNFFLTELEKTEGDENDPNQNQNNPQSLQNVGDDPQANQQMAQQPNKKSSPPPQTGQDEILKRDTKANSNVFSSFIGTTISGIDFKKIGPTGGEINISISKSNMPLKISWTGDKVTVTQPNGNIVNL